MIPLFFQILPISDKDTESVHTLLTWIIGVLLIISSFVIKHLLKQNTERVGDLVAQLATAKLKIKEVEDRVEKEILYNKEQGMANIKMITDIQHVLKDNSKSFSGNNSILRENDTILRETSARIKDIHTKITN
jgi:hypothetical protein